MDGRVGARVVGAKAKAGPRGDEENSALRLKDRN